MLAQLPYLQRIEIILKGTAPPRPRVTPATLLRQPPSSVLSRPSRSPTYPTKPSRPSQFKTILAKQVGPCKTQTSLYLRRVMCSKEVCLTKLPLIGSDATPSQRIVGISHITWTRSLASIWMHSRAWTCARCGNLLNRGYIINRTNSRMCFTTIIKQIRSKLQIMAQKVKKQWE